VFHLLKIIIQKVTFNPNDHIDQNYNIVEDLVQDPCAISSLEVLQHCPRHRRTLSSAIGTMDPEELNLIRLNLYYFKERFSHHLASQIQVLVGGKKIHHTILDEGSPIYVMSLPCWRALGSPTLT